MKVIYDKKILLFSLGLWLFYTYTQSHSISWFDSGELAMVGQSLGISHPPGQPFYILLVHFAHLVAQWINPNLAITFIVQISVISTVLSAVGIFVLFRERNPDIQYQENRYLCIIASVCVFFPIWDQATRIEVYSLASALWIWGFVFFQRWLYAIDHRGVYQAFLCLGLCFCVNPLFAVSLFSTLIACVGIEWFKSKNLIQIHWLVMLKSIGFLILGLLPYLSFFYILSRQETSLPEDQVWIWGKFKTWQDWIGFLTGKDYQNNGLNQWSFLTKNLKIWFFYELRLGWILLTLLAFIGFFYKKEWFIIFLVSFLSCGIFPLLYEQYDPSIPDFQGYFLVQRWLFVIGLAHLCLTVLAVKDFKQLALDHLIFLFIYSLVLQVDTKYLRSSDQLAVEISREILKDVPKNSILVISADHVVFPMLYLQQIQKERKDVILLVTGFMNSSWYWQFVFNHYPHLKKINPSQTRSVVDRLHHLLSQNQDRTVFVENFHLAQSFGLIGCMDGWLLQVGCKTFPKRFDYTWLSRHTVKEVNDPQHDFVIYWWAKYISAQLWMEEKPEESITILEKFSFMDRPTFYQTDPPNKKSYYFEISPEFWFVDPIDPSRYDQVQSTRRTLLLNMPQSPYF